MTAGELWILDVDGAIVIIDAMYRPDTPAELIEVRASPSRPRSSPPDRCRSGSMRRAGPDGRLVVCASPGRASGPAGWVGPVANSAVR
jgi:hypothetical protein